MNLALSARSIRDVTALYPEALAGIVSPYMLFGLERLTE